MNAKQAEIAFKTHSLEIFIYSFELKNIKHQISLKALNQMKTYLALSP